MSRLLTQEEIEALLASGPWTAATAERSRLAIGDPVDILSNGSVVAYGQLTAVEGRTCVRIVRLAEAGSTKGGSPR